ncbi:MAG: hypothetical protein HYT69_03000 [Candidatus Zambryskibacteria bacterium]|nr:hypothetical protein [Candidatus Zambryskibacteria bacterium]
MTLQIQPNDQGFDETYIGRLYGSGVEVRRINAAGTREYSFNGQIQYSDNGNFWTNTGFAFAIPPGNSVWRTVDIPSLGNHRYWRINDGNNLQVDELEVFDCVVPQSQTFSVSKSGTGSGTITSAPSGISCGIDCSESYNYGTSVTLTALPSSGSSLTNWSGDCSDSGSCTVSMTQARNVTANFTLGAYVLNVSRSGTGSGTVTSSPLGINCGSNCSENYDYNTSVTLTATPSGGSIFSGWSGGGCSGTGSCVVTMSSATSVTANFTLSTYNLTTSINSGSGTITAPGINCPGDCTESYTSGTWITLITEPLATPVSPKLQVRPTARTPSPKLSLQEEDNPSPSSFLAFLPASPTPSQTQPALPLVAPPSPLPSPLLLQ